MKKLTHKINFMNLPEEYSGENSKYLLLPINYEGNLSFLRGAKNGCDEILRASYELEYFDFELRKEGFLKGINTFKNLIIEKKRPIEAIEEISSKVKEIIEKTDYFKKNKFLISLGGDHSITLGIIDAFEKIKELKDDFSVIILDAHADLKYSWNNSTLNHACVARNISKKHKTMIVGVRSLDDSELDYLKKNKNVYLMPAESFSIKRFEKNLKKLSNNVYLSIDVDVFDPSIIRFVGTPEPGGLYWNQIISILKLIFSKKNVIASDITEFSPKGNYYNYASEAYTLAKLTYKIINLKD
ncbi:MAG: arginase family protein [Candidatus Woesearchaeota archaeon]